MLILITIGMLTSHRGMVHLFSLPNTENIFGYYQFKTEWKVIEPNEFEIQPKSEISNCHLTASDVTCNIRKFGQLTVINNH